MSGGDSTKGKCVVPKWVAWLTVILLVVAIVLAIVLPLTVGDDDDCTVVRRVTYNVTRPYQEFLLSPFDAVEFEDPFSAYDVPDSVKETFGIMTANHKIWQTQQFSLGDNSGLPQGTEMNVEEAIAMAGRHEVGSYLNIVDREDIRKIQEAAMATDPAVPVIFGLDVVHGYKTMFPVNIGIAATWDRDLVYESSAVAAWEAAADGLTWTFAPMLDISRDPRWGRISESFGEDPYLTGELGVPFVQGFQDNGVAACIKHFAAYGGAQGGRDYHTVQMALSYLHNEYLPAYRKVFDAGAWTAMASFNTIQGVPSHANRMLMTDVLRGMWGWDGMIVADYGGVRELVAHHAAANNTHAVYKAITAGIDMNMADGLYYSLLNEVMDIEDIWDEHLVSEHVDLSTERILAVKHALNLFEEPMGPMPDDVAEAWEHCNATSLEVAQKTAEAAMVLLKNDDNTLPILPSVDEDENEVVKKIYVVGRTANSKPDMLGFWNAQGMACCDSIITFYQGLVDKFGAMSAFTVEQMTGTDDSFDFYDRGEGPSERDDEMCLRNRQLLLPLANEVPQDADYIIYVAGEGFMEHGEASSRSNLDLIEKANVRLVAESRAAQTKMILVVIGGRQHTIESEQDDTIGTGTNTRPLVDAIVQAWSPGTMAGPALANLLSGETNFRGKMPVTTPRTVGQVPLYYSQLWSGRWEPNNADRLWAEKDGKWFTSAYMDTKTSALYPFGYGMSYTTYEYSAVSVNNAQTVTVGPHGTLTVRVTVTNTGDYAGTEIVQVYVRRNSSEDSNMAPNQISLKGFDKITLDAGASGDLTFTLNVWEDFGYYNNDLNWEVDGGDYNIFVSTYAGDEEHSLTVAVTHMEIALGDYK